jgi:SagB-type dehydrogenase family enzyme
MCFKIRNRHSAFGKVSDQVIVFDKERRNSAIRLFKWLVVSWFASSSFIGWAFAKRKITHQEHIMKLPSPTWEGTVSVEQAIRHRRTIRTFSPRALNLAQLSQLLWAASGITEYQGFKRAAPSAGALYPMDVYVVVGDRCVATVEGGVYHYDPRGHQVSRVVQGDLRSLVAKVSLSQVWMARAPITMVITAEYNRTSAKYGKRGIRYGMIEAGHIGQNIFLQAQALGLAAGIVGAFQDSKIIDAMKINAAHEPLLLMPVGYKSS